jgi:hypothetical protein
LPVVQQMGLIRASAVKLRKQNQRHSQDSADDGVGDPGGVGGGPLPPRTESCDPLLFRRWAAGYGCYGVPPCSFEVGGCADITPPGTCPKQPWA